MDSAYHEIHSKILTLVKENHTLKATLERGVRFGLVLHTSIVARMDGGYDPKKSTVHPLPRVLGDKEYLLILSQY